MLTSQQLAAYDRDGHVVVPGLVPERACERMSERIWEALETVHGIRQGEPDSWTQSMPRGLQDLCKSDGLAELAAPAFLEAIDDLLGAGQWDPPAHWGGPLPNFPSRGPWNVPFRMWHLDYPVRGDNGARFATKAICALAPIVPQGGGTVLIERSHRLCQLRAERAAGGNAGGSSEVRKQLVAESDWFAALMSPGEPAARIQRFMVEGVEIDGIHLRVVEFSANPGDVLFFHPWLFHNSSPNCSDTARMQIGQNLTTRAGLSIYTKGSDT